MKLKFLIKKSSDYFILDNRRKMRKYYNSIKIVVLEQKNINFKL